MSDQLMTYQDVADRLKLAAVTVRRMARRGDIEVTRLSSRAIRITEQQFNDYIASRATRRPGRKPYRPRKTG